MKFLRILVLGPLIFLSQFLFAQTTAKWTLEKCIEYAFHNNLQVLQSGVAAKISDRDNLQSKLNLLPTIDGTASYSDNFGNGFNPSTFSYAEGNSQVLQLQLNGTLPLFTGLQQIYNIEKTKFDLLASKYDYENAKNTIALNIASAYLQILLNKEIVNISIKQKELTQSQKDIVINRIKAGALPEAAIYDIESQIGRDEVAIVNAKNSVDLALLALAQLLQLKEQKDFDVEVPQVNADNVADISGVSPDQIYGYAVMNQPSIKSADARVMSANSTRKISYGALSPTIAAFGSLSSSYFSQDRKFLGYTYKPITGVLDVPGLGVVPITIDNTVIPSSTDYSKIGFGEDLKNNFRKVVGVQLDVPLFSKGQKIINMQKAKLQVQLRQLQLESAKNQLQSDIEQAFANAKAAASSYFANKKSIEAAQKSYQSTESRYKAGLASNFDIQQSKTNLVASESQMVQAKYTYVFRIKILDFYQGKAITLN